MTEVTKRPVLQKQIILAVAGIAMVLLSIGVSLSLWSGEEVQHIVKDQFNAEQLVVARSVRGLIERELSFLKREIQLLAREVGQQRFAPDAVQALIQMTFSRVIESGVRRIEVYDAAQDSVYVYLPYRRWAIAGTGSARPDSEVIPEAFAKGQVWVSQPLLAGSEIYLNLSAPVAGQNGLRLYFYINVSWFLAPFIKDIRSGQTGYAWVIDGNGHFLYHPDTTFIGKSAFKARSEKYPGFSFHRINDIQQQHMMRGEDGTGTYDSAWHRGQTGELIKLIAYCPVTIASHPPQRWSVAVVAPESEIEAAVRRSHVLLWSLQALGLSILISAAVAIVVLEMRWSHRLEGLVINRTRALRRSEENYRSLVESAEDFIFTVDADGCFLSVNSFTANFFGQDPERLSGCHLETIFSQANATRQRAHVADVFSRGRSIRDEFEVQGGAGTIWISANFMPVRSDAGKIHAVLCIARDVTENKTLQRHLVNTEKLASIGTLAAGFAHEINNPLGVMLGFCDLLLRGREPGSQEYEDLKTIERQGTHCKEIVENLLSFARNRGETPDYSDLNRCIEDILRVVRHSLEMNGIQINTALDESIVPVNGDFRQLQQVFLNLINNAAAAMPAGGTLSVTTSLEKGGRWAAVRVRDTGGGIQAENLDHIFEPFFTTKPEGEGTGLGLFVSYGIVTRYGGSIDCQSHTAETPGRPQGTTFTVKLPTRTKEA